MRYQSRPYISVARQLGVDAARQGVWKQPVYKTHLDKGQLGGGGQLKTEGDRRTMRAPAMLEVNKYLSRGNMLFSGISSL